jgi:hypothetical protein
MVGGAESRRNPTERNSGMGGAHSNRRSLHQMKALIWMATLHLVMSVVGLWLLLRVASKVGALG